MKHLFNGILIGLVAIGLFSVVAMAKPGNKGASDCAHAKNECKDAARVECKALFEECSLEFGNCKDTTTTTLP